MKYMLILAFLAISSIQSISGDSNVVKEEFDYLRNQVEKIVEPILNKGHELIEKLKKMEMQVINIDTTQCKEFEASLKKGQEIAQNITVTVYKTSLKVKQDIRTLQKECTKPDSTIFDVLRCIQEHPTSVLADIQVLQPNAVHFMEEIVNLSKTVQAQFQQCLKSQPINTPNKKH